MEPVLFLVKVKVNSALYAVFSERRPLGKYLINAHYLGISADENVKVAGIGVLQRCHSVELFHESVGVSVLFDVYGDLQTVQVGFVTNIGYLSYLARFGKVNYLILYLLDSGGGRYLGYLDAVGIGVKVVL